MPNPPFTDARNRLAIRVGRLLGVETGIGLPDRTLLVADGRDEAVVGRGEGLPGGVAVIDLRYRTVLPGLIDTHSHLVGAVQTAGVPATTASAPRKDATVLERPVAVVNGGRVAFDRRHG